MPHLHVNDKTIDLDKEGYLLHLSDWNETVAHALAKEDGLVLTADHWEVIYLLRTFYQSYQIAPAMRVLITALKNKLGPSKGNSHYLHQLFPLGAAKQSNKIAGLPKPTRCI
jgi:TusE/DsrC/DsvC family sulfur relay protein